MFQFGCPATQIFSIPIDDAPRGGYNPASKDDDLISLSVKMSGEDVANLPATSGKNDTEMSFHAWGLPLLRLLSVGAYANLFSPTPTTTGE